MDIEPGSLRVPALPSEGWDGFLRSDPPRHRPLDITRAFAIGAYEVTCDQWAAVMGPVPADALCTSGAYPVSHVSWVEAASFCNRLSGLHGLQPAYAISEDEHGVQQVSWDREALGYRLPTGTEWEYAARGGRADQSFAGAADAGRVGWFEDNAQTVMAVGLKSANGFGLYDMSGNVREWTWDEKAEHDLVENHGVTVMKDFGAQDRQARGGGYINDTSSLRVGNLYWYSPNYANKDLGFRVARSR